MSTTLKIPFISQREQSCYQDISCGAACLLMMLKFHQLDERISFESFCKALNIDALPHEKGYPECTSQGVYSEDMQRYLVKRGIRYRVSFFRNGWKGALERGPIATLILPGDPLGHEEGHWILAIEASENKIGFLDPWKFHDEKDREILLDENYFYSIWAGLALQILI